MLLHFSRFHRLYIWSGSTRIKFQIVPLISVIAAVEFSPSTASSDAVKSSSCTFASSSSGHFSFLSFPRQIFIYIRRSYIIFVFFLFLLSQITYFIHRDYLYLVLNIFLSRILTFESFIFLHLTLSYYHAFPFIVLLIL